MKTYKLYKAKVKAFITILEEQTIWLPARNEGEFKQLVEIEFQKRVDQDYGYVDFDELHFEEIEESGELPF